MKKHLQLKSDTIMRIAFSTLTLFFFSISAQGQLSGTYTIDASSAASATNYTTFSSAIEDMLSGTRTDGGTPNGSGISAAVTFDVANGTYTEQVVMTAVTGSTTNSITFQSASGDSSQVMLAFNAASSSNYVFQLDGTTNVNFSKMSFQNTSSFVSTNIEIKGGVSNLTITNCQLIANSTSFGSVNRSLIRSEGDVDEYITITNNHFLGGGNGISLEGAPGMSFEKDLMISNNTMDGQANDAIALTHQDAFSINNNVFKNGGVTNGSETITIDSASGRNSINYNSIIGLQKYGIHLKNVVDPSNNPTSIYNNGIAHTSTVLGQIGIRVEGSSYINLAHNTTWVYATGIQNAYGLDVRTNSSNITVNGNVFYVETGYAIYDQSGTAITQNDHNLLWANAGTKLAFSGTNATTLAAWQTATGGGANSIQADPMFTSTSDLHLATGSPCIDAGIPVAGITVDLDGDTRNSTPDLGADEYTNPNSVFELANETKVLIYPNPSNSVIHIALETNNSSLESVRVIDLTGRTVLENNSGSLSLDVSNINSGTYFLTLHMSDKKVVVKKIIIQ